MEMTRCRGALIPREEADYHIRRLLNLNAVRKDLRIEKSGNYVIVPLREGSHAGDYDTVELEFSPRAALRSPSSDVNRELLASGLPADFPSAFVRYGQSLMLKPFAGCEDKRVLKNIATVMGIDRIYLLTGRISGEMRQPAVRLAYGEPGITIHKENGIYYCFDPERVMFSPGNVNERIAAAGLASPGSTIFDMFSGIGYFSLPIAKYSGVAKIYCTHINLDSIKFLEQSARMNGVSHLIHGINADCRDFEPDEKIDLALMGNFRSLEYVEHAFHSLKDGGRIVLHFLLDTSRLRSIDQFLLDNLSFIPASITVDEKRIVKSYAPNQWHVSASIVVKKHVHT